MKSKQLLVLVSRVKVFNISGQGHLTCHRDALDKLAASLVTSGWLLEVLVVSSFS